MHERELDLKGLRCPAPIVKLNGAARALAPGEVLRVLASDPAFQLDVKAWCRRTHHELLDLTSADGVLTARIRKAD